MFQSDGQRKVFQRRMDVLPSVAVQTMNYFHFTIIHHFMLMCHTKIQKHSLTFVSVMSLNVRKKNVYKNCSQYVKSELRGLMITPLFLTK